MDWSEDQIDPLLRNPFSEDRRSRSRLPDDLSMGDVGIHEEASDAMLERAARRSGRGAVLAAAKSGEFGPERLKEMRRAACLDLDGRYVKCPCGCGILM